MTTRADRARWRAVLAETPTDTALVTLRAGKLRVLLDALDAAEACHADCEERYLTAEARAMAAEGERDVAEAALAELRREVGASIALARSAVQPGHDGPCSSGMAHPRDVGPGSMARHDRTSSGHE